MTGAEEEERRTEGAAVLYDLYLRTRPMRGSRDSEGAWQGEPRARSPRQTPEDNRAVEVWRLLCKKASVFYVFILPDEKILLPLFKPLV